MNLMLVGCGMMGARHLRGYGELERVRPGSIRLLAVCDPREDAARAVAQEAEELLGQRPTVCRDSEEALSLEPSIQAADVVTDNRSHHAVVIPLLEAGLDVLVEKPLAQTVAIGRSIVEVAKGSDRVFGVAENNRRDPMNRLLRHVIRSGLIGRPHFVLQTVVSPGRGIKASRWRHSMAYGGLALDVGIHQAYMLEVMLGPIESVYAVSQQVWAERPMSDPKGGEQDMPVESDDVFAATLTFESGVQGTWMMHFGSIGGGHWQRIVFGDGGTAYGPGDRSGGAVRVQRDGRNLEGDELLEQVPDFGVNEIESRLFGERPASYSFESPVTDRKLIAAEVSDFIDAAREHREPEVTGKMGLRSVAIVYALLESAACGAPVTLEQVLSGAVRAVQQKIEQAE